MSSMLSVVQLVIFYCYKLYLKDIYGFTHQPFLIDDGPICNIVYIILYILTIIVYIQSALSVLYHSAELFFCFYYITTKHSMIYFITIICRSCMREIRYIIIILYLG